MPFRFVSLSLHDSTTWTDWSDRGQGLQNCMQDCYELLEALRRVAVDGEALHAEVEKFNASVVERGAAEVEASTKACFMLHDWEKFSKSPMGGLNLKPLKPVEVAEAS